MTKVGDKLNLLATGVERFVDLSLFPTSPTGFRKGSNSFLPIDLRAANFGGFSAGLQSGQWAQQPSIAGSPHFSNLYSNGDGEVYANGDLLASGQVGSTASVDADRVVTITPRPLTPAETALVAQTWEVAGQAAPTVLSFAFNTAPYGMKPPFFLGSRVVFPSDMAFGSGDWPATWALTIDPTKPAGENLPWPPEIDVQDGYNGALGNVTLNMGAIQTSGTGSGVDTPSITPFTLPVIPAGATVVVCATVYEDEIAFYVGVNGAPAVCVGTTAGTSTMQVSGGDAFWYAVITYAIQARANAWPGTAPAGKTVWEPLQVRDLFMGAMPAVRPGQGDGLSIPAVTLVSAPLPTPTPAPTPTPVTTPSPTPTPTPVPTPVPTTPTPAPTPTPVSVTPTLVAQVASVVAATAAVELDNTNQLAQLAVSASAPATEAAITQTKADLANLANLVSALQATVGT